MKNLYAAFLFLTVSFYTTAQTFTIQQNTTGNPAVPLRGQSFKPSVQGSGSGSTGSSNSVVLKSFSVVYHVDATSEAAKMYLYSTMPSNATTLTDGTSGTLIAESISKTDNFPYTVYNFDNIKLNKNTTYYALFREDVALESGSGTDPGPYSGGQSVRNNTGTLALLTTADLRMTVTFEQYLEPEIGIFYSETGQITNGLSTLYAGTVFLNQVGTRTLTIKNSGLGTLTVGTVTATGAGVTVSTQPASTVAPGSSTTFVLSYTSSVEGHVVSTVLVPNNDADEGPFDFKYDIVYDYPLTRPFSIYAVSSHAEQINLYWENNSSADQFSIERSVSGASDFTVIGTISASQKQYADNTVVNGVTYDYRVKGKKSNGDVSGYSAIASATAVYNMTGEWESRASFPGVNNRTLRSEAVGLSIGEKGYMGLGYNFYEDVGQKDFWEYDPSTNAWTRMADFEGAARESATHFVIGNKAFVGLGLSRPSPFTYMNDFYVYDPATNDWSPIAPFPGAARANAAAFVINGKAYVGGGNGGVSSSFTNFYEYDPTSNTWRAVADAPFVPGTANASGFGIGNIGYVFVGQNLYAFDPTAGATGTWTQKTNLLFNAYNSAAFVLNSKAYVVGGNNYVRTTQEYNPTTNTWTLKSPYSGVASYSTIGFAVGNQGYVGMGQGFSGSLGELWTFHPVSPRLEVLTAQVDRTKINLVWQDNADNETGYVLERGVATDPQTFPTSYSPVQTFDVGQLSYTDLDVAANTYYVYRMRTKFADGESLNKTVKAAILYPTALQVQRTTETGVTTNWSPVISATSYVLEQASSAVLDQSLSVFTQIATPATTAHSFTVQSEGFFYYRVKGNATLYSDTVSLLMIKTPTNLQSSNEQAGTSVTLTWSDNSATETNYIIERKNEGDANFTILHTTEANVSTYVDVTVEEGAIYEYRVQAKRDAYTSFYSNTISVLVETIMSVENSRNGMLQAYPNPTDGEIMISAPQDKGLKISEATIITSDGRSLAIQGQIKEEIVVFQVGNLPQGLYVLTLPSREQVFKVRFVKK